MPKKNKYAGLTEAQRLEQMAKEADAKDEKKYARRHALYNISKSIIMGLKSIFSRKIKKSEEKRTFRVSISDLQKGPLRYEAFTAAKNRIRDEVESELLPKYHVKSPAELSDDELKEYRKDSFNLFTQKQKKAMSNKNITLTMGRSEEIHLGGTKPMSQYIDNNGEKWLVKQAVNCMGFAKLSGALLTEAGANIQQMVDPATAVQAFVGRTQQHGDVSFQRRLKNVVSSKKLDLFRFSRHPEIAKEETVRQVEALGDQVLREHTTDWLLCNFDTKGENFILTQDSENSPMVLHGIDKEAAFNKLFDSQARHMSRTYQPHANNTLYNVMFTMYAQGKMNLNLESVENRVRRITQMSDQEYMANYDKYLDHIKNKDPQKYTKTYLAILERKDNLAKEYRGFFGNLVNERMRSLERDGKNAEAEQLRSQYLGRDGKMKMLSDVPELNSAQEKIRRMKRQGFLEMGLKDMRQTGMEKMLVAYKAEQRILSEKNPELRGRIEAMAGSDDYLDIFQKDFHNSIEAVEFAQRTKNMNLENLSSPEKAAEALNDAFTAPLKEASTEAQRMRDSCEEMAMNPQKYGVSSNYQKLLIAGINAFSLADNVLKDKVHGVSNIGKLLNPPHVIYTIKLCKAIEKERATNPAGKRGYWEQALEEAGIDNLLNDLHNDAKIKDKIKNFSINDLKNTMLTPTDAKHLAANKNAVKSPVQNVLF